MNILFIHEVDWLRKVIFEIHTLAESLSMLGHKVYAIDYESMWVRKGFFDFLSRNRETSIARVYPGHSISLIRSAFLKIPVLSRTTAALSHYFQIKKAIKEKKIDVIVLYSVPTNGFQTLRIAKKYGIPVVFRSIDVLNQMVVYPVLRYPTLLMERHVYSHVDSILTLSPKLSDYVISLGAPRNKVDILPLGVDTEQFRPGIDGAALRHQWNIREDDPVIVFIGTLFDFSGLDTFLNAFPAIKKEAPAAKLLIVGDGPQRSKLDSIIKSLNLEKDVTITGFQPFSTMPAYINLATVGINPFTITGATRDIFPGKIIQFLACGKVIVCTPLPGMKAMLPEDGSGVVFSENGTDMAKTIVFWLNNPRQRILLEQQARIYVQQTHSYDKIVRLLEKKLEEMVKNRGK